MKVEFVNLTPHTVKVFLPDGSSVEIQPSGQVARVSTRPEVVGEINGIPVRRVVYGEIQGLPEPRPNTYYIVSSIVLQALPTAREDVLAPDTSPDSAVRDSSGQIIGVRYLVRR